jgi:hypothetical protein
MTARTTEIWSQAVIVIAPFAPSRTSREITFSCPTCSTSAQFRQMRHALAPTFQDAREPHRHKSNKGYKRTANDGIFCSFKQRAKTAIQCEVTQFSADSGMPTNNSAQPHRKHAICAMIAKLEGRETECRWSKFGVGYAIQCEPFDKLRTGLRSFPGFPTPAAPPRRQIRTVPSITVTHCPPT